jgi:hypothetical protein
MNKKIIGLTMLLGTLALSGYLLNMLLEKVGGLDTLESFDRDSEYEDF